ncbi:ABC transporter ATP-binding protein [Thalassobaculum salexigens]|uniref:ABC transporter ATP-binding protein n=1 Tax=Thalassobaculum salexigens TaxID=455360 RepID=UPI00248F27B3|nr:ABC transporter ATP-binding protein [Thalassobaculum salexigens]
MTRLSLEGVSIAYGRHRVIHDVTIPTVEDGQLLGLLGPNASGKSTLLRALSREHPATGRIALDGRAIQDYGHADWYRAVAAMPQAPPSLSALRPVELVWSTARTLDLGLSDRALGARIDGLFAALGLEALAMAPLATLSGGKRQLVGFALAMVRDPDVLLLDEPTSALDLYWRLSLMDIVRDRLATRGGVGVVAVHDLDIAARYCDRLALIHQGRLVAAGTAGEVLTRENLAAVYSVDSEITTDAAGRPDVRVLRVAHPPE